jgi:hypothetical protein
MRRAQRRFHASVWPIIAVIMLMVLAAAVVVREHPAPPAGVEAR